MDYIEQQLEKLRKYCAYQDRCHQEVRTKLLNLKVYGDDLEEIMAKLIEENFLNEERFAQSYCRGKYKIKRWGRNKIVLELKKRKISDYCIRKGLKEIDELVYNENLHYWIEKKIKDYKKHSNPKQQLGKFLIQKGYEAELVWSSISSISFT